MNFDFTYFPALLFIVIGCLLWLLAVKRFCTARHTNWMGPLGVGTVGIVLGVIVLLCHMAEIDEHVSPAKPISLSSRTELHDGIYKFDQIYKIGWNYYALLEEITVSETGPRNKIISFVSKPDNKPLLVQIEARYTSDYPVGPQVASNGYSGFILISTEGRRRITKWYPFVIDHTSGTNSNNQ